MNQPQHNTDAPPRIGVFDGLRAVAILFVIAGHSLASHGPVAEGKLDTWLRAIVGNAGFGVQLFFVLSGYLITSLLLKERQQTGQISISGFYARRVLRIFPALYLYLLTIAALTFIGTLKIAPVELLAAATFTWNYAGLWHPDFSVDGAWFLGHMWTLSLEEQFYIFWPFLFLMLPTPALLRLACFAVVLIPAVRTGSYFLFPSHRGMLGMMFHTAADTIFVGCLFSLMRSAIPHRISYLAPWICPSAPPPPAAWVCIASVPLIASPILRSAFQGAYGITIGLTLDAICAGLLICWLHSTHGSAFSWFLSQRPMRWLGRLSYSIYLWQQLFLTPLNSTLTGEFPYNLAATLVAACMSFYLVESPLLKIKNRFGTTALTKN